MKRSFLLSAVIALAPLAAFAQTGTDSGIYAPPRVRLVDTNMLNSGSGTVVVKVLVKADGAAEVRGIVSSSNHELDRTALDIARRSAYRAATKGGVPVVSFYEVTLNFTGNGLSRYETIIGTGAYGRAKHDLQAYLIRHPNDARAWLDLGLAESFTGDDAGAVNAFEKAGPIPSRFQAIAAKSYGSRAVSLLQEQKYPEALGFAKKAVALRPSYQAFDNLGLAELKTGDAASAAGDFEKARALAPAGKASANVRATISSNLAAAYAAKGDLGQAKSYAAEARQLDPSVLEGYAAVRNAYADQAATALKDNRSAEAAALYEQAADVSTSDKALLYANAAFAYLQQKPKAANEKAKAEADKALAIDPHSAGANFAAGVALANQGKRREALTYLNTADESAKAGADTTLTQNIEAAIAQLNGSRKKSY